MTGMVVICFTKTTIRYHPFITLLLRCAEKTLGIFMPYHYFIVLLDKF